jgi:hypothetical protein
MGCITQAVKSEEINAKTTRGKDAKHSTSNIEHPTFYAYPVGCQNGFLTIARRFSAGKPHRVKPSPAGTKEPSAVPPGLGRFSVTNPALKCWAILGSSVGNQPDKHATSNIQ